MVTYLLDVGDRGIVVPQVEDPGTVREISSHVRYDDGRSLGSYMRSARFGNVPKERYADYVNEDLALMPMIETAAGLDAVDEIAGEDAVTALATFGSDAHLDAIDRIIAAAAVRDCPIGLFAPSPTLLERYEDRPTAPT